MLRIDNLEIYLSENILFSAEYLYLNAGEKAAIIGSNDSGKSLLLKSIHGDYSNFKGSIFIKEKSNIFYKKRKHSIFIDHVPRILENKSVWQNIILPLPGITSRTRQKIIQFCETAGLGDKLDLYAKDISASSLKMMELIRAAIQLPYIILIDDIDNYFDQIKLKKAFEILNYATNNGSCVLVTCKQRLDDIELNYRLQNGELVKL